MQAWALIVDSFREARDKRLFWVMLFISTMVGLALACLNVDRDGWVLFFGAVRIPFPPEFQGMIDPPTIMASVVSYLLIDTYIGWLGTAACLVATAGFIPNFLARGGVDVVLGKPMSRTHVLLSKYVGSLSFVLVQATYFVVFTFVVLRFVTGRWFWGYLWAIPLLVALFSYLYCVCTLLALWTRSTLASLMLTLLFWSSSAGLAAADAMIGLAKADGGKPVRTQTWSERGAAEKVLHLAKIVLPKTSDIPTLVAREMGAANAAELAKLVAGGKLEEAEDFNQMSTEEMEVALAGEINAVDSVGSSLAFEAGVLALACWMFRRKDF